MRTSEPRFRDSVVSHTLSQLGLCVSVCPPARQLARAHGVHRIAPPRVCGRPQKKTYFAVWCLLSLMMLKGVGRELRKSRDATHLATDGPAPRRYDG